MQIRLGIHHQDGGVEGKVGLSLMTHSENPCLRPSISEVQFEDSSRETNSRLTGELELVSWKISDSVNHRKVCECVVKEVSVLILEQQ